MIPTGALGPASSRDERRQHSLLLSIQEGEEIWDALEASCKTCCSPDLRCRIAGIDQHATWGIRKIAFLPPRHRRTSLALAQRQWSGLPRYCQMPFCGRLPAKLTHGFCLETRRRLPAREHACVDMVKGTTGPGRRAQVQEARGSYRSLEHRRQESFVQGGLRCPRLPTSEWQSLPGQYWCLRSDGQC